MEIEPMTLEEAQVALTAAKRWPKGIGREDYDTHPPENCDNKFKLEHG